MTTQILFEVLPRAATVMDKHGVPLVIIVRNTNVDYFQSERQLKCKNMRGVLVPTSLLLNLLTLYIRMTNGVYDRFGVFIYRNFQQCVEFHL